jgi:alkanesulfonate monooxygenase SsuD/methylene tetrahydromethanopterin reductase-like flavin-dependent oxidoreductase (luciferase family)
MGERRTLRVVAEVADGWNTFLMPEDEYRHKLEVLAGHCNDFRRDPGDIRKQLSISMILGETEAEATVRVKERAATTGIDEDQLRGRFLAMAPDRLADVLRPFREMGVGDFLMVARPPVDELTMELFAKQVAPRLSD